jgi:hypothetical protein
LPNVRVAVCRIAATLTAVLACATALPAAAAGAEPKPFGIAAFAMGTTEPSTVDGTLNEPSSFDQAGGHPIALTSTMQFVTEEVSPNHTLAPTRDPKDIIIDLPPGLLANPQAVPRCQSGRTEHCPTDTQVGVFVLHAGFGGGNVALLGPIVNLTPPRGEAAELGLETPLGMFLLFGRVVLPPRATQARSSQTGCRRSASRAWKSRCGECLRLPRMMPCAASRALATVRTSAPAARRLGCPTAKNRRRS